MVTEFLGVSPQAQRIKSTIPVLAQNTDTVLLRGETGVGKDVLANLIHQSSERRFKPFVPINCSAITETLVDTELFGHDKGAFTGASQSRMGKLQAAHGGTIFLDEIGDMHAELQSRLLRFMGNASGIREVQRVGTKDAVAVDARVIAATNKDLERLVTEGKFREDLYFRIRGFEVVIPPLRERPADIALIAEDFLREHQGESPDIEVLEKLAAHSWPGNARELILTLQAAVARATIDGRRTIRPEDISFAKLRAEKVAENEEPIPPGFSLGAKMNELEKKLIKKALFQAGGVQAEAARLLGMDYRSLRRRIKILNIR